jgi:carbamoyltransferase
VLVIDGDGSSDPELGHEAESGYLFESRDGRYKDIFKNRYKKSQPGHGLGWAYEYISVILGFVNTRVGYMAEPGKTMGLAPYGAPNASLLEGWIDCDDFALDFSRFEKWFSALGFGNLLRFSNRERALIQNEREIGQYPRDLAFKIQAELERAVVYLATRLHEATGASALCLAGGVALNSVANGRIQREAPFEGIFVQPASGDDGQAIGLAYYGYVKRGAGSALKPIRHAFGGRTYSAAEISSLLAASGLRYRELDDPDLLAKDAASALSAAQIVGWFQGGSEYGPRALGHRSILADPRDHRMKDHLNDRVKFREPFRPFAPSVLLSEASNVFDIRGASPYMLIVADVHEDWQRRVPAITHVDGTARVQTVDKEVDPLYHMLISAFAEQTGVPLVLNTSFNLRGKPIVETPRDALQCFLYTEMDVLYLGHFRVERPRADQTFLRAARGWSFVSEFAANHRERKLRSTAAFRFTDDDGSTRTVYASHLPPLTRGIDDDNVPEAVTLASVFLAFDGSRSLTEVLEQSLGRTPDDALIARASLLAQALLREGVLRLVLGAVEI